MKHRLKLLAREAWARLLWHTGLHVVVDRLMPRRLTVLYGHCVADPAVNATLPADMKISRERLEKLLVALGRRYEWCTIGDGVRSLREGRGRSLVALSMDDGYRDNATMLPALLDAHRARATLFVETRALDERRLNWSHKFFPLVDLLGIAGFVERFVSFCVDGALVERMRSALDGEPERALYRVKRVLKYEAEPGARDAAIDAIWGEEELDEQALCERLYMTWDDVRRLHARGFEFGGHTITHPVLATLDEAAQRHEIAGGKSALELQLDASVTTFAYPFGRAWDFDERSVAAAREAGFECAVTTHARTNGASSDPWRLARLPLDDTTRLHVVATEACGGFDLLRRLGLDLSE